MVEEIVEDVTVNISQGLDGKNPYELSNFPGTLAEYLASLHGDNLEYIWDGVNLGIKTNRETEYTFTDLKGEKGDKGNKGDSFMFTWNGTQLGVKTDKDAEYIYVDLKGDQGDNFEYIWNGTQLGVKTDKDLDFTYVDLKGEKGNTGDSFQFTWQGTSLGVKTDKDIEYVFTDLKGLKGDTGESGLKVYETKALRPTTGIANISYKITNDPVIAENGYFHWNGSVYVKDYDLVNGVIESGNLEAVSGDKINYVTSYKSNLITGKNKFNKLTKAVGIIDSNGDFFNNASYCNSDFIRVDSGISYYSENSIRYLCYYDSEKNVIAGGVDSTINNFTVPVGVTNAIITFVVADLNTMQLEVGNSATIYESYILAIDNDEVNSKTLSSGIVVENNFEILNGDTVYKFNKDTFLIDAKNLYNPIIGFDESYFLYYITGEISTNTSYNTTKFLPINGGKQLVFSSEFNFLGFDIKSISSYNENFEVIDGAGVVTNYTPPNDAKFIKVCISNFNLPLINFDELMIEYGLNPSTYESYHLPRFNPNYIYNNNNINVEALDFSNSVNLAGTIIQGVILIDGVTGDNSNYWMSKDFIKVNEDDRLILYEKDIYQKILFKAIAAYDSDFNILPTTGISDEYSYSVPIGVSYIRFSYRKVDSVTTNVQLTSGDAPKAYNDSTQRINDDSVSKQVGLRLKNTTILSYGDSITAGDEWLNFVAVSTGIDTIRNIAIGGGHINQFSTRTGANPYDYLTSFPYTGEDDFNDAHLNPQIDHTPNTLRFKYDLIAAKYLQTDGRYMLKPDIVTLALGFNDWINTGTYEMETWNDVKDLDYAQLITRANDTNIPLEIKTLTFLRIALEKLLGGEITETLDGYTYGVDCRKSKFIFSTPIQNADPFTYVSGGATTAIHTKNLQEFGDYISECLNDYGIKRINGYTDSSICYRFENLGASGKFLKDGIHPNIDGYRIMGKMISGGILSTYL